MKVPRRNLGLICKKSRVVPDGLVSYRGTTPPKSLKGYFNSNLGGTLGGGIWRMSTQMIAHTLNSMV